MSRKLAEALEAGRTEAKVAFLGTALSMGAQMLAPALARKALPAVAQRMGTGLLGQAADLGVSSLASSAVNRAVAPPVNPAPVFR